MKLTVEIELSYYPALLHYLKKLVIYSIKQLRAVGYIGWLCKCYFTFRNNRKEIYDGGTTKPLTTSQLFANYL